MVALRQYSEDPLDGFRIRIGTQLEQFVMILLLIRKITTTLAVNPRGLLERQTRSISPISSRRAPAHTSYSIREMPAIRRFHFAGNLNQLATLDLAIYFEPNSALTDIENFRADLGSGAIWPLQSEEDTSLPSQRRPS